VIEDEPVLLQALREEGYAADQALDSREGLSKAEGCEYEAIVLDLRTPTNVTRSRDIDMR
jgi:two-component system, OmpR family, response regulator